MNSFFYQNIVLCNDFCVNLPRILQRVQDILLNNLSITTRGIDEQTFNIGTATQTGAAFPYLKVACGEPRDVWEMSAPLVFEYMSNLKHHYYEEKLITAYGDMPDHLAGMWAFVM